MSSQFSCRPLLSSGYWSPCFLGHSPAHHPPLGSIQNRQSDTFKIWVPLFLALSLTMASHCTKDKNLKSLPWPRSPPQSQPSHASVPISWGFCARCTRAFPPAHPAGPHLRVCAWTIPASASCRCLPLISVPIRWPLLNTVIQVPHRDPSRTPSALPASHFLVTHYESVHFLVFPLPRILPEGKGSINWSDFVPGLLSVPLPSFISFTTLGTT